MPQIFKGSTSSVLKCFSASLWIFIAACHPYHGPASQVQALMPPSTDIFARILPASSVDGDQIRLQLGTQVNVSSVILCLTANSEPCAQGRGEFLTADLEGSNANTKIFRINVAVSPADRMNLIAVAIDDKGGLVGWRPLQIKKR